MVLLKTIREFIFQVLSPSFCESCRCWLDQRTVLCASCVQKIVPVVTYDLILSAQSKISVYALGAYQDPLKCLILAKQRSDQLASVYLATQIYEKTVFRNLPCDFLIPIPLHWSRRLKRGYNQALVMAQQLQKLRSGVLLADVLKRQKVTKYQAGLSRLGRFDNLKNAFALKKINPDIYRDKHLILIDDVFTSGATLAAAAKELLKLRPKTIAIIVACRAI
jgi:ComF family protein